jgi:hypothetical protein
MAGLGAVFQAAPAIFGLVSAAWDALTAAEYASMLPYVLIIAGLAAIALAGYELVTHWSEIWGAIKDAAAAVWQWIVDHWPLLLEVILGPIGAAVVLVVQHWSTIKNAAMAVWQWIVDNWNRLTAIIVAPIQAAVGILQGIWDGIKTGASGVWGFIKDGWNGLVDFFTGLPGRISGLFSGMWDGIWHAFRSAINTLIDGWNSLQFTTPHVSFLGVDTPSVTIGVPKIPHLAQGGLITQTGLIYDHAGASQRRRTSGSHRARHLHHRGGHRPAAEAVGVGDPDEERVMASCVRQAWLTLGAQTIQLENTAGGWFCEQLDLGYPSVRAVVNNRPDVDGIDDRTTLMGERAITANLRTLSTAGAQIDAVAASFAPFMVPAARPVLHYVLDRPGAVERTFTVRAAGYAWPIAGPIERSIHLQWIAADPIARDPTQHTATAFAGASSSGGRVYNLAFNRSYPGGGGTSSTAPIYSSGDVAVRPLLRIYGPVTQPVVQFTPQAGIVAMLNTLTISAGHYVEVDCAARTAYLDGDRSQNQLTQMDWAAMNANGGWPLIPARTNITMAMTGSSTTGNTQTQAVWNDGYLT